MVNERCYLGARVVGGEVEVATTDTAADDASSLVALLSCPYRLYRRLQGSWSVYELQIRKNRPIRLRLIIASERHESQTGCLSPQYIKPAPAVLFAIADALEHNRQS